MVFKNLFILVLWVTVASALEELDPFFTLEILAETSINPLMLTATIAA